MSCCSNSPTGEHQHTQEENKYLSSGMHTAGLQQLSGCRIHSRRRGRRLTVYAGLIQIEVSLMSRCSNNSKGHHNRTLVACCLSLDLTNSWNFENFLAGMHCQASICRQKASATLTYLLRQGASDKQVSRPRMGNMLLP